MISKTAASVVIIMLLNIVLFAGDSINRLQEIDTLPWQVISEKFEAKKMFCNRISQDGKTVDLTITPVTTSIGLPFEMELPQQQTEIKLNVSKWQQGTWTEKAQIAANIGPDGLRIKSNVLAEGFHELKIISDEDGIGITDSFFIIVTSDWKKDLLSWCRVNKEMIETNPDSQLIYSSIAVSHLDIVMGSITKSKTLSGDILSTLSRASKAKADFENGDCPDLAIGLNRLKLKRFEGSDVAEFVIYIPQGYSNTNKWPIYLRVDPDRFSVGKYGEPGDPNRHNYHDGMLNMWWHTTSHDDMKWKDYIYLLQVLKQHLTIDENRIYLYGHCGNGIAAMALAVHYPDQWAECFITTGNSYRHMAGNTINLAFLYDNKYPENDDLSAYFNFAVKCFEYFECRNFKYIASPNEVLKRQLVPTGKREISPYRVFHTIESLANSSSYWICINGREDENFIASIDAIVWGQSILIKTDNVDAYTLNLELAPLDSDRPVKIIENDKLLDIVTGPNFVRRSPEYENALYVKDEFLNGPVSDVFTDRYAVVWKGDENIERISEQLAGSGPCFEDFTFPRNFIDTHNIIFVGNLADSEYFAKIIDKLPVMIEDNKLTTNDKVYEGDLGAIFVYPNPLNCQKYLAIFSASTSEAAKMLGTAWEQLKNNNVDVGVFRVDENNKIQWVICEKFSTVWNWHPRWDMPLATLEKEYSKLKWHQWAAKTLKKVFDSDVVILEDMFTSEQIPADGILTIRDITRIFRNDWIVKVSLKGRELRNVLMVPFDDISAREIPELVIEGISLVKQFGRPNIISINEIDDEKIYTAVLPYKAINGSRIGVFIKGYRIEDQGFFIPLLRKYLYNNKANLDHELKNIKLSII